MENVTLIQILITLVVVWYAGMAICRVSQSRLKQGLLGIVSPRK